MNKKANAKTFTSTAKRKGLLIAFEGIDGAGKTTQTNLLYNYLRHQSYKVLLTREPTDGPYGQKIRSLFVSRQKVTPEEELDLFTNDRRQHVDKVIVPALDDGWIVLTDRYYFSTMAYQGAMGLSPLNIRKINEEFAPIPDLVILLVARPRESVQRIKSNRREIPNSFEKEDYLKQVQDIFLALNDSFVVRIDGDKTIADVQTQIRRLVDELIAARPGLLEGTKEAGKL